MVIRQGPSFQLPQRGHWARRNFCVFSPRTMCCVTDGRYCTNRDGRDFVEGNSAEASCISRCNGITWCNGYNYYTHHPRDRTGAAGLYVHDACDARSSLVCSRALALLCDALLDARWVAPEERAAAAVPFSSAGPRCYLLVDEQCKEAVSHTGGFYRFKLQCKGARSARERQRQTERENEDNCRRVAQATFATVETTSAQSSPLDVFTFISAHASLCNNTPFGQATYKHLQPKSQRLSSCQ